MDCCIEKSNHYDLVIIGSGSAAFAAAIRASELKKTVAMVEEATIGGTCVNVGCVPSKTLIRAAESKFKAEYSSFKGVDSLGAEIDFTTLIKEKDSLVDSLRQAKYEDILQLHENITLIKGTASFSSLSEVQVDGQIISGDRFFVATGAHAWAPPIQGLSETAFLTSTTAFELENLPRSIAIIGGRSIALEIAQMLQRLGSKVTLLQRSKHIIPNEDSDLSKELTEHLINEGINILTGVRLDKVLQNKMFSISYQQNGKDFQLETEQLLVAAGRKPNSSGIGLEKIGVKINTDGSIKTNQFSQTTVPHIYAAGDVTGKPAYVYTAAYSGKLAVDNAFGETREKDFSPLPYVIFTDPQVARVGLNEQMAQEQGIEIDTAKLSLDNVPRAIAARDTRGFIKLVKEKGGEHILGATILAPEGSELLMEIAVAIKYQIPVHEIANMLHPYLTMGEGVKLAAQTFGKDISQLSCCAA